MPTGPIGPQFGWFGIGAGPAAVCMGQFEPAEWQTLQTETCFGQAEEFDGLKSRG